MKILKESIIETKIIKINYKKLYEQKCKELEQKNKEIDKLQKKLELLKIENNIPRNKKNIGEKDEILLVQKLYNLNEEENYKELINIFGDEASEGIIIINLDTGNEYNSIQDITKAKSSFKADTCIKMNKNNAIYFPSIKSKSGATYAILNHTPRHLFHKNKNLNTELNNIDILVKEYNKKRSINEIGEDINILKLDSLKNPYIKESIIKCLIYFIFNGTGKGDSIIKANSLIFYKDDIITFEKYLTMPQQRNYIDALLCNCIISMRDKGMSKKITNICKPWVYEDIKTDGTIKYKGSLHIRCK